MWKISPVNKRSTHLPKEAKEEEEDEKLQVLIET